MVEPIKMSFAVWLLSGTRNCVLGRVGMFFFHWVEKTNSFHGKTHPGKNSFCRQWQKLVFSTSWQKNQSQLFFQLKIKSGIFFKNSSSNIALHCIGVFAVPPPPTVFTVLSY